MHISALALAAATSALIAQAQDNGRGFRGGKSINFHHSDSHQGNGGFRNRGGFKFGNGGSGNKTGSNGSQQGGRSTPTPPLTTTAVAVALLLPLLPFPFQFASLLSVQGLVTDLILTPPQAITAVTMEATTTAEAELEAATSTLCKPLPSLRETSTLAHALTSPLAVRCCFLCSCPQRAHSDALLGDAVAAGINGRKETAYVNANTGEYPQAEAQNPNIIANADCDILSEPTHFINGSPRLANNPLA